MILDSQRNDRDLLSSWNYARVPRSIVAPNCSEGSDGEDALLNRSRCTSVLFLTKPSNGASLSEQFGGPDRSQRGMAGRKKRVRSLLRSAKT